MHYLFLKSSQSKTYISANHNFAMSSCLSPNQGVHIVEHFIYTLCSAFLISKT